MLENSRMEIHDAVDGLTDEHASLRPGEGRWSVLECIEHIAMAERRFLGWLEKGERLEAPDTDEQKGPALLARLTNRSTKAQAPEPVQPAGRFHTLAHALEDFNAARAQTVGFVEAHFPELDSLSARHPFFGLMSGYHLLFFMSGHARRHAEQIRETRTAVAGAAAAS